MMKKRKTTMEVKICLCSIETYFEIEVRTNFRKIYPIPVGDFYISRYFEIKPC